MRIDAMLGMFRAEISETQEISELAHLERYFKELAQLAEDRLLAIVSTTQNDPVWREQVKVQAER